VFGVAGRLDNIASYPQKVTSQFQIGWIVIDNEDGGRPSCRKNRPMLTNCADLFWGPPSLLNPAPPLHDRRVGRICVPLGVAPEIFVVVVDVKEMQLEHHLVRLFLRLIARSGGEVRQHQTRW